IITADNPRSESLEKISKEIEKGLQDIKNSNYRIIPDRFQAIQYALEIAEENDIVLIAGKGPEKKQIYQDRVVYHNDEEAVRQILKEKG
ncbi:MAG: UDP-N-acetylmuramoyl-L-alanyl-D-glutamate--2,6-diaminopimelate ligase, partial [Arcobacteraceae bacterium]